VPAAAVTAPAAAVKAAAVTGDLHNIGATAAGAVAIVAG
jgi:hypothetical protein